MSKFDLLYDYEEALQRINRKQFEINAVRQLVKSCATIPQSITDKQVKLLIILKSHYLKLIFKSASMFSKCL